MLVLVWELVLVVLVFGASVGALALGFHLFENDLQRNALIDLTVRITTTTQQNATKQQIQIQILSLSA